jgi:hypothetical protein
MEQDLKVFQDEAKRLQQNIALVLCNKCGCFAIPLTDLVKFAFLSDKEAHQLYQDRLAELISKLTLISKEEQNGEYSQKDFLWLVELHRELKGRNLL